MSGVFVRVGRVAGGDRQADGLGVPMSGMLARMPRARLTSLALAIALSLGLSTWAPAAHADNEAARQFSTGAEAFERGDFSAAARAFDAANAIAPAPAAVFNAARAWVEAKDRPRAADRYATFLESAPPDVDERVTARRELARLRRELVVVRLEGPPEARVTVGHVEGAVVPVSTHLEPGAHPGTWSDGTVSGERFFVEGRAGQEVRITLRAPVAAPPLMPFVSPPPEEATGGGVDGLAVAGTTLLVLGVAGVGVGVGVGVAALGARDDFVAGGSSDADLHAQADDLRTASNVTWVAGAAVGTLGLVLLVTTLTKDDQVVAGRRGVAVRF